jgi:chromatin structure-remodeling complex subunit RSC1/2
MGRMRVLTCPVKLFERDDRQQVLWFSGPPLPQGAINLPDAPAHSLEYLEYLSKRKRGEEISPRPRKRLVPPSLSDVEVPTDEEPVHEMWWAEGQTAEQIAASLRAMVNASY